MTTKTNPSSAKKSPSAIPSKSSSSIPPKPTSSPISTTLPFLSVIIPAYNEKRNLKRQTVEEVFRFLEQQNYSYEIILSDDGSTDGTSEALDKLAAKFPHTRVIHNPHAGKAQTVAAGMLEARGRWRLFTDFDQSTPISEVDKLLTAVRLNPNLQIAFGSREGNNAKRENEPWIRHLMGRVFNWMVQIIALPGVKDTQCGFKMFSQIATEQLFPYLKVYGPDKGKKTSFTGAFDVELLYLARKRHLTFQEFPVRWTHHHADLSDRLHDASIMAGDLIKIRWTDLTGGYNHKK